MFRFTHAIFSLSLLCPLTSHAQEQSSTPNVQQTETGKVTITSTVRSEVIIGHKVAGKTPLTVDLPPGQYKIRVAADGFDPFVRRVRIEKDKTKNLNAILVAGGGTVEFQSSTPKSSIFIEGLNPRKLPVRISDLDPGKYKWTLKAPGHEEKSGEFSFGMGSNVYVYENLESSAGLAEFASTPKGASVFLNEIDGEPIGFTPLQIEEMDADEHIVILQKKGYASVFRRMDTTDGYKGTIKAVLPKNSAKLVIKTNNKDAAVRLEGVSIGKGTKINFGKIETGIYSLSVSSENTKPINRQISIPKKGTVTLKAELAPAESEEISQLTIARPLFQQWYFWAGIGSAAAVTGSSAFLIYQLTLPTPAETVDVTVQIP